MLLCIAIDYLAATRLDDSGNACLIICNGACEVFPAHFLSTKCDRPDTQDAKDDTPLREHSR